MPYWFENKGLRVGRERDKRRKLTDEDRKIIKQLYKHDWSIRAIARKFKDKTTRRNIQFILFPERLKRQYEYRKLRNWDYDRERHKKAIKNYRRHLKEIYGTKNASPLRRDTSLFYKFSFGVPQRGRHDNSHLQDEDGRDDEVIITHSL